MPPAVFIDHAAGDILPAADWTSNWSLVEASLGVVGPYIQSGLVPTAGTGLAVNVSSGNALIGANIVKSGAWSITALADNTVNHLWLLQNATGTSNTTGTQPANSVKLGTATTAGGVVTSVDTARLTSGRQVIQRFENVPLLNDANTFTGKPQSYNTTPAASANSAVIQIGNGGFAGGGVNFAGGANGTWLGMNVPGASTARFLDCQVDGVSKLLLGVGGVLTVSNKVATNGLQVAQATKTANYTLTTADYAIVGDAASGSITITLPTAAAGTGQQYWVGRKDASANTVTLKGNGAELINGANTYVLTTQYQAVTVFSDGASWWVM